MQRSSAAEVFAGILACALLAVLASCAQPPGPDVVLITVDTTRADHLGSYGYPRPTSPNIDALAAEATLFRRATAHAPITLPSHTSIMTGTFPTFHGVRDNGAFTVRPQLETLAERLRGAGYETAAFVSAFVLDSRFGLDQGFDLYDDHYAQNWSEEELRDRRLYNNMIVERPADQTTAKALEWLEKRGGRPFFLWVHYYDPHQRYAPPRPFDDRFRDSPYDGEIAFMDSQIGELLGVLRRGRWHQTLVVLTGDHGEGLGQHGELTHAILAYDATLRVPLIVKPPAAAELPATTVDAPVSHVDIVPTLSELLSLPRPEGVHGRSLVPLMAGAERPDLPAYFESNLPRFSFGWAPLFGVRSGFWKYLHGPRPELYHLERDPGEVYDLARSEPEQRRAMEELLFEVVEGSAPPADAGDGGGSDAALDAETRRRLEALGYVGGDGGGVEARDLTPREPSARRSPRQGLTYLNDYHAARGLASAERFAEAAEIYERILIPFDPENPGFLSELANLKRRLGDLDGALELLQRAQAVAPDDVEILLDLGLLELDRGRSQAAEGLFAAARQLAPENIRTFYLPALAAARTGDVELAIERYGHALEIDPSHFDSLVNLGVELDKAGRGEQAMETLRRALELDPLSSRVHYNLGLVHYRARRGRGAIASFEAALRYRESYLPARLALGLVEVELGDPARGRAELERLIAEAPASPSAARARTFLSSLDAREQF